MDFTNIQMNCYCNEKKKKQVIFHSFKKFAQIRQDYFNIFGQKVEKWIGFLVSDQRQGKIFAEIYR